MNCRYVIVSATRKSEKDKESLLIHQSYLEMPDKSDIKLDIVFDNTDGLPTVYNRKLEQYKDSGVEFLVFVHDDVFIDDLKLASKLSKANKELGYGIVGLAGGLNPRISNPALWHLMTERKDQRGEVAHPCGTGLTITTPFGPSPSRVAIMDGLFFGVHLPSIKDKKWKFNENYKFHHYDIASCIDANKCGIKLGVYPIHVIHSSPGLMSLNDKGWMQSNETFIKEYSR